MTPSVLLITPQPGFEDRVRRAFDTELDGSLRMWWGHFNGEPGHSAREVVQGAAVVAIGPEVEAGSALELASAIDHACPDVSVVIVAEPSVDLFESALRVGVREVIAPGAPEAELRVALERAIEVTDRRRALLGTVPEAVGPTKRVITVLSPKGGTGKTTIATNLAVGLAKIAPGEVVIVDLDLQFGDVAHALRLSPDHTFVDVARSALDPTTLKVHLTHHSSGFFALCAPALPADADDLTAQHVQRVLELLAAEFRYVIVDTGAGLVEASLAALDQSTDLVLLSATDVPSVRATEKEIDILRVLGNPAHQWHFVLNRADSRVGLRTSDIEATVGLAVDVKIPSSRAVPISLNEGSPVLVSDPRSPVSRALVELVNRFVPQPAAVSASAASGMFRRRTS